MQQRQMSFSLLSYVTPLQILLFITSKCDFVNLLDSYLWTRGGGHRIPKQNVLFQ